VRVRRNIENADRNKPRWSFLSVLAYAGAAIGEVSAALAMENQPRTPDDEGHRSAAARQPTTSQGSRAGSRHERGTPLPIASQAPNTDTQGSGATLFVALDCSHAGINGGKGKRAQS
jgi:hypothetical protein